MKSLEQLKIETELLIELQTLEKRNRRLADRDRLIVWSIAVLAIGLTFLVAWRL